MSSDVDTVRAWLRERGTETIDHPGGTLYAHLGRIHDRLGVFGHDREVRLAGLTHAAYGTDGFDLSLLGHDDREPLRQLIGARAEDLVHRYASCDRSRTWKSLPRTRQLWNRWSDRPEPLPDELATAFADLSVLNELDVVEQDPAIAARYGGYFQELFASWRGLASDPVLSAAQRVLSVA